MRTREIVRAGVIVSPKIAFREALGLSRPVSEASTNLHAGTKVSPRFDSVMGRCVSSPCFPPRQDVGEGAIGAATKKKNTPRSILSPNFASEEALGLS